MIALRPSGLDTVQSHFLVRPRLHSCRASGYNLSAVLDADIRNARENRPTELTISGAVGLLLVAVLVALAARRLRLPYTVGLVVTGTALALLHVNAGITLTRTLIFDALLPALLFEAALSLSWQELRRDVLPIGLLVTRAW